MKHILVKLTTLCLILASCSSAKKEDWKIVTQDPELVHGAVKQVTDVIVHDIFSPPVAARIYTYMSVAGYEIAIQSNSKYISLAGQLKGLEAPPKPEAGQE